MEKTPHLVRQEASDTFAVQCVHMPPWTKVRGIASPRESLVFVVAGGYSEGCEQTQRGVANLHSHPAGDLQTADVYSDGAWIVGLCFNSDLLKELPGARRRLSDPLDIQGTEAALASFRIHRWLASGEVCRVTLDSLGFELLDHLAFDSPLETKAPKWLSEVSDRISLEPSSPYSLAQLAQDVAVHPAHLARECRRRHGCTIGQKLRKARVERALHLLLETSLPVEDVALRSGFYDTSHLTRSLRAETGWTATALRDATNAG